MGFFRKLKSIKNINWKQVKENLYYLSEVDLRTKEQDLIFQIKDETIEECVLEFAMRKEQLRQLRVLDAQQTMQLLRDHPRSFTRYGDGEIHVMQGKNQPFQRYDPRLAEKLLGTLSVKREDVYVGLNHAYWEPPTRYAERNQRFYRINGTGYRRFFSKYCDPSATYLDAACFGVYYRFDDTFDYDGHYQRVKNLFAGKKVAIIAGEGVIEKLDFDVFELAQHKMVIHGPRIDAFSEYERLMDKIDSTVPKDYLLCLILGQTATAMVPDLTDLGYMAWDVGHMAKDYDAYMNHKEKTEKNMDAFWNPD